MKNKSQIKLKVCGLRNLEQIQELIALDTDFLGFIFYEKSPRYVQNHLTLKQISEILHSQKVGVFVNESIKTINETVTEAQLDFIQLHGDENSDFINDLRKNLGKNIGIIKAVRIGNQKIEDLQKLLTEQSENIDYFLFDTDSAAFGGTGKTFDWEILNELKIPKPYFLSGGISQENFQNINQIHQKPFALDINSKFETEPGNKDVKKIKAFKEIIHH